MPLGMQEALTVQPPCKDRHPGARAALARRRLMTLAAARGSPPGETWRGRGWHHHELPPGQSKIFAKLFENSQRMFFDPDAKLKCVYDQLVLAGRGTPVDKEVLKAPTCCRYHWMQYQAGKRRLIGAVLPHEDPFRSPTPASAALQNLRRPDRLTRRVWRDLNGNARVQASLAAVTVRWHRLRNDPGYDLDSVYQWLRPYGEMESLVQTSPVSARIVFADLTAACKAVAAHSPGRPDNPLLCLWYHAAMKNKGFYVRRRHLHVALDPYAT